MRSHLCGTVNTAHLEQEVVFCGWVHRRRDHGGVIFVDLRDHTGIVQVVFDPDRAEIFALAEQLRNEFVLCVGGRVRNRPEGTINPDMPTGEIEVLGTRLELLNRADTPPSSLMTTMSARSIACVSLHRYAPARDAETPAPARGAGQEPAQLS